MLILTGEIAATIYLSRILPGKVIFWALCARCAGLKYKKNLFDKAMAICLKTHAVTAITKNGIAFQTSKFNGIKAPDFNEIGDLIKKAMLLFGIQHSRIRRKHMLHRVLHFISKVNV